MIGSLMPTPAQIAHATRETPALLNPRFRAHPIIQREHAADIWDEVQPLLAEHYDEIAVDKHAIPLDPDKERYLAMEKNGGFVVFTARADGKLIGYAAFFVMQGLHYRSTKVGINDVLFVSKPWRNSRAGLVLVRESESYLRVIGVKKLVWHIKPEHDWSAILVHSGYALFERTFAKLL